MQSILCVMFVLLNDIFLCGAALNLIGEELPWQPFPVTPMEAQFPHKVQTVDPKQLERKVQNKARKQKRQDRPHQCEQCHRAFVRISHLQRHLLSHTDAKPHHCFFPGCMFRSRRKDNLMQHMRVHAPELQRPLRSCASKNKVEGLKIKESSKDVGST